MWKFLDVTIATINRNDCSINKKPHPTLIVINPRIILRNPDDVIPLAVTSRNSLECLNVFCKHLSVNVVWRFCSTVPDFIKFTYYDGNYTLIK